MVRNGTVATIQSLVSWSTAMISAATHNQRQPLSCHLNLELNMVGSDLYQLARFTRLVEVVHTTGTNRRMVGIGADIRTVMPATLALGRGRGLHPHPDAALFRDVADLLRAHRRTGRVAHSLDDGFGGDEQEAQLGAERRQLLAELVPGEHLDLGV